MNNSLHQFRYFFDIKDFANLSEAKESFWHHLNKESREEVLPLEEWTEKHSIGGAQYKNSGWTIYEKIVDYRDIKTQENEKARSESIEDCPSCGRPGLYEKRWITDTFWHVFGVNGETKSPIWFCQIPHTSAGLKG